MNEATRKQLVEQAKFGEKPTVTADNAMIICSHPLAARIGKNILSEGGNAADAVLGASVTQTVVEPHMTELTGVLSMLYYDADEDDVTYMNGNMNAPLEPLPNFSEEDLETGRGAGVPGFWAGFEAALDRVGSVDRERLISPAIEFAEDGFEMYPFLYAELFEMAHKVGHTDAGRRVYMPEGHLPAPGELFKNPEKASVLRRLLEDGNDYFYEGEFAERYCETVQDAGGVLTREDFERYEVRWQEPAEGTYRGYDIVASPPPDTGGTHVIEALNMFEQLDLDEAGSPSEDPETMYYLARIHNEVLVEGARQRDPESHGMPLETILSKEYAKIRLELLEQERPKNSASLVYPGSCQVTAVDEDGNVATALHSCMAYPWTNGLFVDGVSVCASGAHFLRSMPTPGHRASTVLVSNMVFEDGTPVIVSGSPSAGLLSNVLQNTVNILEFGLDIEDSVTRPRFGGPPSDSVNQMGRGEITVESDLPQENIETLRDRGIDVTVVNPYSWQCGSFEGIHIDDGTLRATPDPRRNSSAEGY